MTQLITSAVFFVTDLYTSQNIQASDKKWHLSSILLKQLCCVSIDILKVHLSANTCFHFFERKERK